MTNSAAASPKKRMEVGVILPLSEDTETDTTPTYADVRALALKCEANGFDSVWVYDHLIYRFPEQPTTGTQEAWTIPDWPG